MRGVLRQGQSLVGEVEEDDRRAQHARMPQHLHVDDVADPHQQKDQHLAADALEADLAGELLVRDGAHDAGQVVAGHEDDERDQETVASAEEVAEPASDGGEDELDRVPEFLHGFNLRFLEMGMKKAPPRRCPLPMDMSFTYAVRFQT